LRTLDPAWGGPVEGHRRMSEAVMTCKNCDLSIEIACSDEPNTDWHSKWQFPVHALGAGGLGKYGYNAKLWRWLNAEITRFDVVVISSIWLFHSFAARAAAIKAKVPYILYVHGALDPWFKKHYPVKHLKKALYWKLIEARVFRDAAAVVFTTEEERLLARNAYHPYVCKERVISYGTASPPDTATNEPQQQFRRAVKGLGESPYLLYLGRLHEKKGIDLLLKSFEVQLPLAETHLVIAGPGESHALQRDARASIAADRIHFIGPVYSDKKWAALRGADALVLPSHAENFGISVAEALGCGVPVLISNKVNIWREVQSTGAGFINNDDLAGTTRSLGQWASLSPDAKSKMRSAARLCFEQHFDIQRGAHELLSLLGAITRRFPVTPRIVSTTSE
jgi:glycosyltransferase involved in cell wall biosynthesis